MNCNNNQNNNGCGCNCNPHPTPAPEPVDINMSVCDSNINMLPMLQTYTTKVLKPNLHCCKNILTQRMMNCPSHKYVIKWDFDLCGKTITVPEGCILEFDGGTLKNGTIIGQDTVSNNMGDLDNIFGENLVVQGTWRDHFAKNGGGGGIPDKPYDPEHHSGLGRKTLELKGGSNILTQDDFNQENTIYVVGYDFDLDGDTINVPEGCVISFDGGSITNGELISNSTIVSGDFTKSKDSLVGVYRNIEGKALDYNFESFGNYNDSLLFGEVDAIYNEVFDTDYEIGGVQSIVSDENYFFIMQDCIKNDTKYCCISLYDRNFNYKGSTIITNYSSHPNDSTIYGGNIYITRCSDGVTGLLKVSKNDVIQAVNNNNNLTAELVLGNAHVVCIDYDPYTDCFWIEGDGATGLYNTNFTKLKSFEYLQDLIQETVGTDVTIQSIIFRRGVVYHNGWAYNLGESGVGKESILSVRNGYTGEIIENEFHSAETGYYTEPEGAFWDPVLDAPILCYMCLTYGSSFHVVCKSKRKLEKSVFVNTEGAIKSVSEHITYVNGTYEGYSTGQADKPFKTLSSALACTVGLGKIIIYIQDNSVEYIMPSGYITNERVDIRSSYSNKNDYPRIKVQGISCYIFARLDFRNVHLFSTNTNKQISISRDSTLSLYKCIFDCDFLSIYNNSSLYIGYSDVISSSDAVADFEHRGQLPLFCTNEQAELTFGYDNTFKNVRALKIVGTNDVRIPILRTTLDNGWLIDKGADGQPIKVTLRREEAESIMSSIFEHTEADTIICDVYTNLSGDVSIYRNTYIVKTNEITYKNYLVSLNNSIGYRGFNTPSNAKDIDTLKSWVNNHLETHDAGTSVYIRDRKKTVYFDGRWREFMAVDYGSVAANGSNLIKNSSNLKIRESATVIEESGIWRITNYEYPTVGATDFNIVNNVNTEFVMTPSSGSAIVGIAYNIKLAVGHTYTFGIWVKGTGTLHMNIGKAGGSMDGIAYDIDTQEWEFKSFTCTINSNMVNEQGISSLYLYRIAGGVTPIKICAPKLEFGCVATAWEFDTFGGPTTDRPSNPDIGFQYFDSTLGKGIVFDGTTFVNVDGTPLT